MAPRSELLFTSLYFLPFCFRQPNGVHGEVVALIINYLCALLTAGQNVTCWVSVPSCLKLPIHWHAIPCGHHCFQGTSFLHLHGKPWRWRQQGSYEIFISITTPISQYSYCLAPWEPQVLFCSASLVSTGQLTAYRTQSFLIPSLITRAIRHLHNYIPVIQEQYSNGYESACHLQAFAAH
jgi:hypothetical protein